MCLILCLGFRFLLSQLKQSRLDEPERLGLRRSVGTAAIDYLFISRAKTDVNSDRIVAARLIRPIRVVESQESAPFDQLGKFPRRRPLRFTFAAAWTP